MPPADTLWSVKGIAHYRNGMRPDPVGVFVRVADVIDRFIDFARSLADQRTMAEAMACYALSTWFLDGFSVIGFIWPNGDRGSGKTQLIVTTAKTSYLGQVITAGGSFASLRDLADYGATLAFDDAENLADPKRSDPDKRTLLLAGNRRGSVVPLKEVGADQKWHTRYVNTFCPRLFSATRLPDPILASRSIVVPLIRTDDRTKANCDPEDLTAWPHDRRVLVDDLWALALANLPQLRRYEAEVNESASLAGRSLEPWKALLAVARWLTDKDAAGRLRRTVKRHEEDGTETDVETTLWERLDTLSQGYQDERPDLETTLWERLDTLSQGYQDERPDLETTDLTALTIRALCHYAINSISAIKGEGGGVFVVSTSTVKETIEADAAEDEVNLEGVTSRRVGRVLGRMRLAKAPRAGGKGSRRWRVTLDDLRRWTTTYGIPLPKDLDPLSTNGTDGGNGTNGTGPADDAEVF